MKSREVSRKRFQTIARRNGDVPQSARLIELNEFSQRYSCDSGEVSIFLTNEQLFSISIRKRMNHFREPSSLRHPSSNKTYLFETTYHLNKMGMMRIATMFTTLIIGFTAGPAVSL